MPYVADTHTLIWYMTGDRALSPGARRILERADGGGETIYIPCVVFFELLYLVEKSKVPVDFDGFVSMFSYSSNFVVEPMCIPVIEKARKIPKDIVPDPWDRLIAGTSKHLSLPLITRDARLRKIGLETIW